MTQFDDEQADRSAPKFEPINITFAVPGLWGRIRMWWPHTQSLAATMRNIGRWYNAWFTLLVLLSLLPASLIFILGWIVGLTRGTPLPKGFRPEDVLGASSFALLVLIVLGGFCLSRAQATPPAYPAKAKRYRLTADALFRASLCIFATALYGLLAQAQTHGLFKVKGDALYQFIAWLSKQSEHLAYVGFAITLTFVLMAMYQYMRVLFHEVNHPEDT